jgi:hypothetical protein
VRFGAVRAPLALAGLAFLALVAFQAACGGEDADRKELDRLKSEVEFTFDEREIEQFITTALDIADRRAGTAVGDEAFAFAETTFLEKYGGFEFANPSDVFGQEVTPAPEFEGASLYLEEMPLFEAFLLATPDMYDAQAARAELRGRIFERADHQLFRLDETLATRTAWVSALSDQLTYDGSFTGTTETEFSEETTAAAYLRGLAERTGETGEMLAALDALHAALVLAQYAPHPVSVESRDGVIVSTFTAEEVATAAGNLDQLSAARDAAASLLGALPGWSDVSDR